MKFEIPNKCGECKHIGCYEHGPFARNPHCCCELYWELFQEEVHVKKDEIWCDCPLRHLEYD